MSHMVHNHCCYTKPFLQFASFGIVVDLPICAQGESDGANLRNESRALNKRRGIGNNTEQTICLDKHNHA